MIPRSGHRPRRKRGEYASEGLKFSKPRRQKSDSFIRFIHGKVCVICRAAQPEAHHLHTKGAGGSDFSCIPVCRLHHSQYHQLGRRQFEDLFEVNCWRINAELLVEYFTT